MHILLLGAAVSIHCVRIANGLLARGHRITLVSLPTQKPNADAYDAGVEIVYLPGNSYFLQGKEVARIFREKGCDVVYAHYATGYGNLLRASGIHPSSLAVWGSDVYEFPRKSLLHRWLLRRNLAFPDVTLSTSYVMAKEAKSVYPREYRITPFGVDTSLFRPSDSPWGADGRTVHLGIIKGLDKVYGIEYLIEAMALLKQQSDWFFHLSIYGDGPQEEALKALCAEKALTEDVIFCGRIPNEKAPEVLRTFDCFLAPSLQESFGVAAVEAMACGVPLICSDAEGFREVTDQGRVAYMVPRADARALADAVMYALAHPEETETKRQNAIARVKREYDWQKNLARIEEELERTIQSVR